MVLASLIISFILFTTQSIVFNIIHAIKETLYSKSQISIESNNLSDTIIKNNNSTTLIFSSPFYISNTTLKLDKIPIEKSSTIQQEVQIFVEKGVINGSLVTYNVGYYLEDINTNASNSKLKHLSTDFNFKSGPNYAKGSGFFLAENGDIIKWDAFGKVINKSSNTVLYARMMFFSPAVNDINGELTFLKNRVAIYEFSIDSDATISPSSDDAVTDDDNDDTPINTMHRSIWFWPKTY